MADGHVIKITAPILTKFCTVTKTTKYSPWVVQRGVQHIQDGVRPPSWKTKNGHVSQWLDQSTRNLARWHLLALRTVLAVKMLNFKKFKMANGGHLENEETAISWQRLDRSAQNLAWWCTLALRRVKKEKASHTRYRALGPEVIPVYRQSAHRWL